MSEEAGVSLGGDLDLLERQPARRREEREEPDRKSPEGRGDDAGGADDPRRPALPPLEVTDDGPDGGAHDDQHHRSEAGHHEPDGPCGEGTRHEGSEPIPLRDDREGNGTEDPDGTRVWHQ